MGKRTVFIVLAYLFVDIALAVFSFVARWVVQLLDFIVRKHTVGVIAVILTTLYMVIDSFPWISTLVTVVMVVVAACQFMHARGLLRTEGSLESLELKTEVLVFGKHIGFRSVEIRADEASLAVVVLTFLGFIE